jgi:GTP-binding protein
MTFTLAIVGRPNVGKSTLFNRLVGRKLALVDDQPGVTRDLREGDAKLFGLKFTVIDTAGLEDVTDDSLQGRMRRLTERAVDMADVCLFLIDGRAGVTATDEVFADILRKRGKNVILGVNKAEGKAGDGGAIEAWSLGLGEPLRLSAEHGEGMDDLFRILVPIAEGFEERARADAPAVDVDLPEGWSEAGEDMPEDVNYHAITDAKPLQIAVIGRPNAASPATRFRCGQTGRAPRSGSLTPRACARRPGSTKSLKRCRCPTACARCALPKWWWSCWTRKFRSKPRTCASRTLPKPKAGPW